MTVDDVYAMIRSMNLYKKVDGNGMFFGIGDYDVISFEYCYDAASAINIVCPHDKNGDFIYVEINDAGLRFTKVFKGGEGAEDMELTNEDQFFQENTISNMGFSLSDYNVLLDAFKKYYNGFLKEFTVYL